MRQSLFYFDGGRDSVTKSLLIAQGVPPADRPTGYLSLMSAVNFVSITIASLHLHWGISLPLDLALLLGLRVPTIVASLHGSGAGSPIRTFCVPRRAWLSTGSI